MEGRILLLVFSFFQLINFHVYASTHWVVTEDGRIQQQIESSFAMVQPDNLAAFINQERNQEKLKEMHKELIEKRQLIEKNEDKDEDLESHHYTEDKNCQTAGKRFSEFDLEIYSYLPLSENDIEISDHLSLKKEVKFQLPNCTKFFNLPFSVHAYDHLLAVQKRKTLMRQPKTRFKNKLEFLKDPRNAAGALHDALEKNSTSWVLYNLASFYWRLEGNTSAAVECIRRALHFSPETSKDIALVNLAEILYQSDYTENATVVLLHAQDINGGKNYLNWYHLGNMFASIGSFNRSIYYYEKCLRLKKDFDPALFRMSAVKCELGLQEKLEAQHESLQRTLKELQDCRALHDKYSELLEFTASQRLELKDQIDAHLLFEQQKVKEGAFGNVCHLKNKDGKIVCELPENDQEMQFIPKHHQDVPDVKHQGKIIPASPAEKVFEKIEEIRKNRDELLVQYNEYQKKLDMLQYKEDSEDTSKNSDEESSEYSLKKPQVKLYHAHYDFTHPSWPPKENCKPHVHRYPEWDEFPSDYVDPEARGFPVRQLLTSYIGIAPGEMHATPWKKPECSEIEGDPQLPYDVVPGISSDIENTLWKQDIYVKNYLLEHVNKGKVWPDDIGQRIFTALKKADIKQNHDHKWVLYNLAGLFWRVDGDNRKAVECLRRSIYYAPKQHRDAPLTSLANIMYRNGRTSDALNLFIYALKLNNSEVSIISR